MTGAAVAIAVVALAATGIAVAVQKIMDRAGISPAEPGERSAGFGDVITRLRGWLERRRAPD